MATAIFMPKAGMAMEEGTLIRWLVNVGDRVEMNEPVMEIETDKISMESEAPATGILLATLAKEGDVVPVLQTIGWIGEEGEEIPEAEQPAGAATQAAAPAQQAAAPAQAATAAPAQTTIILNDSQNGIPATPYAKKLMQEHALEAAAITPTGKQGEIVAADVLAARTKSSPMAAKIAASEGVSLAGINGSGSGGRIMKSDVLSAVAGRGQQAAQGEPTRQKLSAMRKVIAERMYKSYNEIPTVTQDTDIDVTELLNMRAQINEKREKAERISVNDFVLRAAALASVEYPEFRSQLEGDELVTMPYVNMGMAVSTDSGLLVPVIPNAHMLSLSSLSAAAKDVAARARANKLQPDELAGSTLTISNLGMYGVASFTPIINQPNSAIIGVCAIRDELAQGEDGQLCTKKIMRISITLDHRIMDGAVAAQFALHMKNLLERPLDMLV